MIRSVKCWSLAAIMLVCAASGCGESRDAINFALEDVNVLLIVVDTLGAAHSSAWTPGLGTTPNIDALAAGGVQFRKAYAPSPWTQPSVASLMTGLTPSHNGVLHILDTLPQDSFTLASALKERGFRTTGVISHFLINYKQGFGLGFERYNENAIAGHTGVSSQEVTKNAINEMRRFKDERFFLFAHYFDPHSEYIHHPKFDRTSGYEGVIRERSKNIVNLRSHRHEMDDEDLDFLRGLYREEIAHTDHYVGKLLAELESLGLKENTLVVLTADHGEEFMEHGWLGHTRFLYDTLLHVPMIISLPGRLKSRQVDEPVSLVDIMPTLLGLSATPPDQMATDGRSLVDLLEGAKESQERPLFHEVSFLAPAEDQGTEKAEKQAFLAAVSLGGWKLIHDLDAGSWSLFDRKADPLEKQDRFRQDHEQVKIMQPLLLEWEEGKVDSWGKSFEGLRKMSEEDRKKLRSLGYVR